MAVSSQSEPANVSGVAGQISFVDLAAQQARIRPAIDAAIARVLAHGHYIMGPEIEILEQRLAAFAGARHVISCASGTDALLMVLMACAVGQGDAIFCPGFTYTATPEVIALLGATPVLADVREDTFNLDVASLPAALETARCLGLRPRGIIAVDLFGQPADYGALLSYAEAHGLFVLADAAQSFGATIGPRRVGTFGLATATSFFPAKPLGCYGDGGAVLTDDDALAEELRSIRQHGKGADKYDIVRVGINGRLDTLQAAILIEKLGIFPDEIERRQEVASRYSAGLNGAVRCPCIAEGYSSVWAQYTVLVPENRDGVLGELAAQGIPARVYYPQALNEQAAYRSVPIASTGIPVSECLPRQVLSLPMHPYLSLVDQDRIVAALRQSITQPEQKG